MLVAYLDLIYYGTEINYRTAIMDEASQRIPTSIKLEEEERLEQFRDEMEDVWIEYQRAGLHATGEEVSVWMESWFSEDEKTVPECHS
jgi:predicted transcriptional regulator